MEEKNIPYIVYESAQAKNERTVKRLVLALIISLIIIFASNAAWLYAWCQYDYASEQSTVQIDAKQGAANYIGNDGDIVNGKDNRGKKGQTQD